ncbi:glutathione peroxidase [Paenibacillus sp. GP183]|uniref:glutathione peroxidase n=1 Tax=Paenibacillus sp. GP183 TaxID=1882751 RepID=UPI000896CDAB|nr:glutathione peroxidase [Paenibacillus sp. GP183]SEC40155.1 glutathione peroxidase [Paenibacillus sp. GP183]
MSVYTFSGTTIQEQELPLSTYDGKVLLIVNTASKCMFTKQYKELQQLYDRYKDKGFAVLGFPTNEFGEQEPGTNEEINQFCETNYGVTFPMFAKINVKGPDAHPLFQYLTMRTGGLLSRDVKWNFTKFLVDRQGNAVRRFAPVTAPSRIAKDIEKLL